MLKKLHHVAYRCRDAGETRAFYEDLIGLKFAAAMVQDAVPSLKQPELHNHVFFEMSDGSFIAFFDILSDPSPGGPAVPDWAQHLALEVESEDEANRIASRLREAGTDVLGPVDHGITQSWYFYDPNGHRMEMALRTDDAAIWHKFATDAPSEMTKWEELKAAEK